MTRPSVLVNGRFMAQSLTGVQRFATETLAALDRHAAATGWEGIELAVPSDVAGLPALSAIRAVRHGRRSGQAWEQLELPALAAGRMIVSLGNTAPLRAGRRQVVVIHDAGVFDTPQSYGFVFRAWYRIMQRRLARQGATIATVSRFSRGRIAPHLGIPQECIPVLREGGEHLLRAPPDQGILERHRLMPGGFALVVGSLAAHKGLEALAAPAALLACRGMRVAIAGGLDTRVFQDAGAAGHGRLQRLGRVTDAELRALYEAAACLLFPSRYEGFGLPPVEAMACGCPVIAEGSGAVAEICGDAALYAPFGEGAAAALARLLDEPDLAGRLVARGRAQAARYRWDGAAEDLASVIMDMGARGS